VPGPEAQAFSTPDDATHRFADRFALRPPGRWYDALDRRLFACGRRRHWFLRDPGRLQQ
jgi:hypothetical protein